jgi:hypothetical protein
MPRMAHCVCLWEALTLLAGLLPGRHKCCWGTCTSVYLHLHQLHFALLMVQRCRHAVNSRSCYGQSVGCRTRSHHLLLCQLMLLLPLQMLRWLWQL